MWGGRVGFRMVINRGDKLSRAITRNKLGKRSKRNLLSVRWLRLNSRRIWITTNTICSKNKDDINNKYNRRNKI